MSEALRKVSTGFKLVYYGLVIVVLAVIVGIVGGIALAAGAAAAGGAGGAGQGAAPAVGGLMALLLVVGGLAIIGSIVGLVGRFNCLAIPDEAGSAKPMIVTSVVLEVIALLISVVNTADSAGGNFLPAQLKMVTGGLSTVFSIVAAILFLLFTRSAAEYVRRPRLADKAMSVLWLWVACVGCYAVGLGVVFAGGAAGGWGGGGAGGAPGGAGGAQPGAAIGGACVGAILMLAALVLGLIALVRYARLLNEMSQATLRFADRAGDYEEGAEELAEEEEERPRRRSRRDEDEDEEDDRRRPRKRDDNW